MDDTQPGHPGMLLYAIGLELTIVMAFWLCLGVWQKGTSTTARRTFLGVCWAGILWCTGELLIVRGIADEVTADRIRYAGILALPPLWAGLAGHATRMELARRVPWYPVALMTPLAGPYLLMFSERWSGLFMGTVPGRADVYGPLWWVAAVYAYLLVVTGSALFVRSALRAEVPGRRARRLAVGLAALVPLAGNAAYVSAGLSWPADPTPVLFGAALIALRSAIFTGGLLQALPISQHELIRQLPLGVILTDRHGVVIDVNPAAERRLGVTEVTAVGRNLDAILTEAGSDVRADISPVFAHDREAGQLVLIDPPRKAGARVRRDRESDADRSPRNAPDLP